MCIGGRGRTTLIAILLASSLAVAQQGTGSVKGKVAKDGEGVGAVTVLINELKLVEVTDEAGEFVFDSVPVGSYTVIFTRGNNTASRTIDVVEGVEMQLEIPVDWEIGVQERVTVTAAAARAAKIVDAPAAITSIPVEQIEQQASHGQLPKILEFTPGAEVTQSGLYDFNFNTRGFNSSLNRRVSTYIDGRDVGVVLLGAQEWAALSTPLDDLAALEFIRGPSAALYGANASSGVVNITTKAPRDSQGTMLRYSVGELSSKTVDFRHAGELGGGFYIKVLAGYRATGDFSVSRAPKVCLAGQIGLKGCNGNAQCDSSLGAGDGICGDNPSVPEYGELCREDLIGAKGCLTPEKPLFREQDNEIQSGSVRLDRYFGSDSLLTFEAGTNSIEGPVFQTGIGRVQVLEADRPWGRINFSNEHWNILGHYTNRDAEQANLTKALIVNFGLITDTERYGVEAQGNWNFGGERGRFVIGAAHTEERVDTADDTGKQTVVFEPIETDRQAIFSQLDWKLSDHFKLVFAGRVDENTLHDTQFSPKAAVVYSINPKNSFRFTFNKAFQVANYSEFFLHARLSQFPLLGFVSQICEGPLLNPPVDCGIEEDPPILAVGNDDLELEKTTAFEVGYSGLLWNKAFFTVDYYNAENEDFITDLVPQVGTSLGNPINTDYLPWVGPPEAEETILFDDLTVAQALRNAVDNSVGGNTLGFRLAQDLDGSTVVVARSYANVGSVDTQGVDFGVQLFLSDSWQFQASYSWFDFEILDVEPDIREILLPNTPEHKASLGVTFSGDRFSASLSGRWVDDFFWSAGVNFGPVESYTTVDLIGNVIITPHVSMGLNVANVLNNRHRQTFGGDLLRRRALSNLTFRW